MRYLQLPLCILHPHYILLPIYMVHKQCHIRKYCQNKVKRPHHHPLKHLHTIFPLPLPTTNNQFIHHNVKIRKRCHNQVTPCKNPHCYKSNRKIQYPRERIVKDFEVVRVSNAQEQGYKRNHENVQWWDDGCQNAVVFVSFVGSQCLDYNREVETYLL